MVREGDWQASLDAAYQQLDEAKCKRDGRQIAKLQKRIHSLEQAQRQQCEPVELSRRRYAFVDQ